MVLKSHVENDRYTARSALVIWLALSGAIWLGVGSMIVYLNSSW